jgi:hypothetical protein
MMQTPWLRDLPARAVGLGIRRPSLHAPALAIRAVEPVADGEGRQRSQ